MRRDRRFWWIMKQIPATTRINVNGFPIVPGQRLIAWMAQPLSFQLLFMCAAARTQMYGSEVCVEYPVGRFLWLPPRLESLMLESMRLRNNFLSGILAPQGRLGKRWKRLTAMQIS